ncbi:MAG TPA: molybdopterin molybdotransferase MoeA [Terracidiphilus sp.]|nr:molybdopterin molybdotransferase MoeA [Terracidiphilus sp.]
MVPALPDYEQAAAQVAAYAAELRRTPPAAESVDLAAAAGRVLARPLHADSDQPPFARTTRDGFACRARDASAHRPLPIAGSTRAGDPPPDPLPAGAAWEIMTGAPVPEDADAVMMIEHVEAAEGKVRLLAPRKLAPGENIISQGAQARKGDELLPAGTTVGFAQIALAAACGHTALDVYRRPLVAILSTGDELVPIEQHPAPGQIRNSSAPMLAAMAAAAGGEPWILPIAGDSEQALDAALRDAASADALVLTGGVSAGKFDLVEPALTRAGARFFFTGARIQPGKPIVFAEITRLLAEGRTHCPVFGLPGNPVSSAVTFLLFAAPVAAALAGRLHIGPRFALARLGSDPGRHPRSGLTRFLPALCDFSMAAGKLPEVELVAWQGSGDQAALARSNCLLVVPEENPEPFEKGATVRILLP